MNRKYLSILSAPLIAGIVAAGSLVWLNRASARDSEAATEVASYRRGARIWNSAETQSTIRPPNVRSVIKVHTDHGVITMSGSPDSWEQVEEAVFVADSIADVQLVNNEVGWTVEVD
ncbi:MAG TPA: hypothetical protein VEU51_05505 [Candidatus Acidoferrales bacterium]|nr:hypothetical protein [Candidatus Acidoferrales bacterium]